MITADGENLVFLLSLPRSGSTLVSLLLGSHPAICCPPEPWLLLKLAHLTEPGASHHPFDDRLAAIGLREFLTEPQYHEAIKAFAVTAYNEHLRPTGKRIFVDKTPRYYHILDLLDTLFPHARKIWLQRDPLDVAASVKARGHNDVDQIAGREIRPISVDFAKGLWELERYFAVPSQYKITIRYEDFVEAPEKHAAELCTFLNVEPEVDRMLAYAENEALLAQHAHATMGDANVLQTAQPHASSVGRWAERLTPAELQAILALLGADLFHRLGYEATIARVREMGVPLPTEADAARARATICTSALPTYVELRRTAETLTQANDRLKRKLAKERRWSAHYWLMRWAHGKDALDD